MKALANNTLQQFNVINDTFDVAPPAYTRVSMLELTPIDEYVPNGAVNYQISIFVYFYFFINSIILALVTN